MKKTTPLYLAILFVLIASCGPVESKKTKSTKPQTPADSSEVLKLKPLSTEKTHEGGVDTSLKIFEKE